MGPHDGIVRHGHERHVAGIDEDRRQHGEHGFAPDAVQHLCFGVDAGNTVDLLQVSRRGVPELLNSVVGVAAVLGFFGLRLERPDDAGKGHLIRLAYAEIDKFRARMSNEGGAFCTLDLLELVDLLFPAEHPAADAIGKKGLNVGFLSQKTASSKKCKRQKSKCKMQNRCAA